MSPFDTVVEALEAAGMNGVPGYHDNWMFECPAHDDNKASLSVAIGDDGRALVYCFAGCSTKDVIERVGLTWAELFPDVEGGLIVAEYIYTQSDGTPHIKVIRYQPKRFKQQRYEEGKWEWGLNGVERIPYNLRDLDAAGLTDLVYVTEGEKDADTLISIGYLATTFLGGAGKWRDEYAHWFQDREVVVIADADDSGREGASRIAAALRKVAASIRVVVPAVGKDVTDHIRAGLTINQLVEEGDGLDEFGPMDWDTYEVEHTDWLLEPYVPRSGRVLAFGEAGSLKSLWAMWLGAHVARDGGRVAYFSLEMPPRMTAQRLKRLDPPKDRFLCFTKDFRLGSPAHTEKLIRGLKDFDLVIIDSWSAARAGQKDSNEQVAELDTTFFLPIIRMTGAAVVVIDNTGHAAITDKGPIKQQHARGASAKGDKMDVTVLFDRPYEDNNYLTRLTVKKMRFDHPWPPAAEVYTPTDTIEFYYRENGKPMWPGIDIIPKAEPTVYDEAAVAGLRDRFSAIREGTG